MERDKESTIAERITAEGFHPSVFILEGYVHQPWGILGYAAAVFLGFPVMMLATKLWKGWR